MGYSGLGDRRWAGARGAGSLGCRVGRTRRRHRSVWRGRRFPANRSGRDRPPGARRGRDACRGLSTGTRRRGRPDAPRRDRHGRGSRRGRQLATHVPERACRHDTCRARVPRRRPGRFRVGGIARPARGRRRRRCRRRVPARARDHAGAHRRPHARARDRAGRRRRGAGRAGRTSRSEPAPVRDRHGADGACRCRSRDEAPRRTDRRGPGGTVDRRRPALARARRGEGRSGRCSSRRSRSPDSRRCATSRPRS